MACFGLQNGGLHRVAVLSPHLDDAVLSLGASISEAARHGNDVTVITVFAGDPDSFDPAGRWDRRTGFTTAGEAVRHRREEDRRACELVGAEPVWLPYVDGDYGRERSGVAVGSRSAPGRQLRLDLARRTRWAVRVLDAGCEDVFSQPRSRSITRPGPSWELPKAD